MTQSLRLAALPGLRWTLGLVVLWQSFQFAFSDAAARHFAQTGLPTWVRHALGGSEIIAALLFLLAMTRKAGGYLLLVIFVLAALIHVLHGSFDVSTLLVYAMATAVCITQNDRPAGVIRD